MWEQLKETLVDGHINWRDLLDDRQRKQVEFSEVYARDYHHGADGHNNMMIIAKMSEMLDAVSQGVTIKIVDE